MMDSVVGNLSTAELSPLKFTNHTIDKMTLDEMLVDEMMKCHATFGWQIQL
jgi:hypothetical protein